MTTRDPLAPPSSNEPVRVLARAEGVVLAYKPASWATEPTPQSADSVVRAVALELGARQVHAASRLDVGVSGVVLCTVDRAAHRLVAQLRMAGELAHRYLGLASGTLTGEGCWGRPLGRSHDAAGRAVARTHGPGLREARTAYQCLATTGATASLLRFTPETGRMHQIRAHAAAAGHPLLGDRRYGGGSLVTTPSGRVLPLSRVALHCAELRIGTLLTAHAPAPLELRQLWTELGGSDSDWP